MLDTHTLSPTDHDRELAARIDRRRQIADQAVAAFGGDRLALVAAVARRARAARDTSPSQPTTPATTRPSLLADEASLERDRRRTSPVGGVELAQHG